MSLILSYDIGSTGCKSCLYRIDSRMELLAEARCDYPFTHAESGGAEQDPALWLEALRTTSDRLRKDRPAEWSEIAAVAFCAQMQGLVLVDRELKPLRPAMSYMDQRAVGMKRNRVGGGVTVEGFNLGKLLRSLRINGAAAVSAKDPVWKYLWVREHEGELFAAVHKWLDVKEYLIAAATGNCVTTRDSAFATFLTDERRPEPAWSPVLCRMYGVEMRHLPRIIDATDTAGTVGASGAELLGIPVGTPVFGGGGDASMIAVGTGATKPGDTYVYTGTSGWVSTAVTRRTVDVRAHVASIVGAIPGLYNYFAEQETAGKCLEWVRDHLALDEIDIYLKKESVADSPAGRYRSLYDFLIRTIEEVEPGCGGLIFAPWLHGNRAPFEDPDAGGIFFNIRLSTGKRRLIRAVVEGICLHQRWLLDSIRRRFPVTGPVRFSGGGALSPVMAQILADILGCPVAPIRDPQNAGAAGAALTAAAGLGAIPDLAAAGRYVPVEETRYPAPEYRTLYDRHYEVLKRLYRSNRGLFRFLNRNTRV